MTREYHPNACQDCGAHKQITLVTFWIGSFEMQVCSQCSKQYPADVLNNSAKAPSKN